MIFAVQDFVVTITRPVYRVAMLLSYTADCLLALRCDTPPARPVRKTLFRFYRWSPVSGRQHVNEVVRLAENARQAHRERQLRVGWLNVQSLGNKTTAVHEEIEENCLHVLALTEVWHRSSDDLVLKLATPSNFLVVDAVRESSPGHGGIAVLSVRCQSTLSAYRSAGFLDV